MAAFDAFLRLTAGRGAQAVSRILPTSKERVLQQLEQAAPSFFSQERAAGATFDPRRGRFLEVGQDRGQMMSPIKNMPENVVRNPQELLSFAQRPDVMPTLQRGGFMGSWFDPEEGGLVVDPSRRFATRTGALLQGLRSNQKAGFDLGRIQEFPVSPGELARQAAFLAPGAAVGGVSGYAAGQETGVNPLLAGLAGAALGTVGGSAAARFARLAPMAARRGAATPDFLTGGLAGAGAAAGRFKEAAANEKFAGVFGLEDKARVAQRTISDILGGRRLTAPTPKEIASLPATEDFFQRLNLYTSPKLTNKDLALLNPETRAALDAGLPLDIRMLGATKRGLGSIPETLPEGGYELGSVFKQVGMKPITVGNKKWDMTKVSPQNVLLHYAQKGDLDGFAEAYSKMLNNQLSLYPENAVKSIVDATEPEFYPVARDFILAVSEATGLPPHVIGIGLAAASQNATPTKEILRLIQAAKILVMKDGRVTINAVKNDEGVWVTGEGVKIPEGQFTVNSAKAMVEVINNPAYAHTRIPGIANKTWLYNMSKFDPQNFGIYTNDSIDSYTLAATTGTPITISDFVQSLAGRSVGQGATRAQNLPGPSGQAVPWFAMRALRPDTSMIGGSFTPELLDLTTSSTKNLENIDEVAEFAKSQIDDLLKSGELGSSYKMTDQGILVPDITKQPGLLVPYEARNQASMELEASMGKFAESIGGATRAGKTRAGATRKTTSPETEAAKAAKKDADDIKKAFDDTYKAAFDLDAATDLYSPMSWEDAFTPYSEAFRSDSPKTFLGRAFKKYYSIANTGADLAAVMFNGAMKSVKEIVRNSPNNISLDQIEDMPAHLLLLEKAHVTQFNLMYPDISIEDLAKISKVGTARSWAKDNYEKLILPLSKIEKETLFSLLPEWEDSLDQLVATAKSLSAI